MIPRSVKSCGCPQGSCCMHGTEDMDDWEDNEIPPEAIQGHAGAIPTLSNGQPSTLESWREIAKNYNQKAIDYIDGQIVGSPHGKKEVVNASEDLMRLILHLFTLEVTEVPDVKKDTNP